MRLSQRARRGQEDLQDVREWSRGPGGIKRPSWSASRGQDTLWRAGSGRESLLAGLKWSRGPPGGTAGVRRPF